MCNCLRFFLSVASFSFGAVIGIPINTVSSSSSILLLSVLLLVGLVLLLIVLVWCSSKSIVAYCVGWCSSKVFSSEAMANRVKEDEKNERIIRNLLKLADNRRCINCNSLVCLPYYYFFFFFFARLWDGSILVKLGILMLFH